MRASEDGFPPLGGTSSTSASLPFQHSGKRGSKHGGDHPGVGTRSKQKWLEEGMACEEHECQAPADQRLNEPDVQDH